MNGTHDELVEVRDRRELPFFQVHLAGGPRDPPGRRAARGWCARSGSTRCSASSPTSSATAAITTWCRSATTRSPAAGRSARAPSKRCWTSSRAQASRGVERVNDPARGAAVTLVHLPIQDGAWTALTVAMAERLATDRPGGHLLRDLGLVVVLLELCAEQRGEHGGLRAETTRARDRAARRVDWSTASMTATRSSSTPGC